MNASMWDFYRPSRSIGASGRLSVSDGSVLYTEQLSEEKSDACLNNLLIRNDKDCFIDANCREIMMRPTYHGFSLTHQLLYTIIAQQVRNS